MEGRATAGCYRHTAESGSVSFLCNQCGDTKGIYRSPSWNSFDSLKYAAAALTFVTDDNPSASADMRPTTFAQAHALRGRVFAGQGAHEDAERSFAAAIHCAKSHGLRLYEMLAVRDLKRLVLDGDGREEEGTKQLKAVLQEMHGPAEELTKLLGDGFDAEEILRS
jgi:hypothetical protein